MRLVKRNERYKIYDKERLIGYFNVSYTVKGRLLSVDLIEKSDSFLFLSGHIEHEKVMDWLVERIVPKTRMGIENNLREMKLSEYDELEILKYTSAECIRDAVRIDFTKDISKPNTNRTITNKSHGRINNRNLIRDVALRVPVARIKTEIRGKRD